MGRGRDPTSRPITMSLPRASLAALLLAVLALAGCARRQAPPGRVVEPARPVNYYVRVPGAAAAGYEITMVADRLRRDSVDFVLPAWIPGQYATRIPTVPENFTVRNGQGEPIPVRRLAVNAWRLYPQTADYLAIEYRMMTEGTSKPLATRIQLDLHGGYAIGGALLGYLDGFQDRPVTLSFDLPSGWRASAPLQPAGPDRFAAASYLELPGTPFVIGDRWLEYRLFVQGKPHQITVQGAGPEFAPDTLLRLINETIDQGTLFYGRPPYERYQFAIHFVSPDAAGMGATGQLAGSSLFLPPLAGNRMRESGLGSVLLHQYLHAWLPGQFGPAALLRPDYRLAPRVSDAWLIEGAAEYYARLLPVRYGAAERPAFYDAMADVLWYWRQLGGGDRIDLRDLSVPGRSGDSSESSRLVAGGTLAVFMLDLMTRDETHGLRGLDQLVHFLQRRSARTGYDESEVWTDAAATLELPPTALSLVATRGTISIEANLARAGLRAVQRQVSRRSLGAVLAPDFQGRFLVTAVERGGTAASAGLREGDRLLEINSTPIAPEEAIATRFALTTFIEEASNGAPVRFKVERNGRAVELSGSVRSAPATRITIVESQGASPEALTVRSSLFGPGATAAREGE